MTPRFSGYNDKKVNVFFYWYKGDVKPEAKIMKSIQRIGNTKEKLLKDSHARYSHSFVSLNGKQTKKCKVKNSLKTMYYEGYWINNDRLGLSKRKRIIHEESH